MSDKSKPIEVEIVRPVDGPTLIARLLVGLASLALIAWAVTVLIGALFPSFQIGYWQTVAAIILARLTFGVPWQPRNKFI